MESQDLLIQIRLKNRVIILDTFIFIYIILIIFRSYSLFFSFLMRGKVITITNQIYSFEDELNYTHRETIDIVLPLTLDKTVCSFSLNWLFNLQSD